MCEKRRYHRRAVTRIFKSLQRTCGTILSKYSEREDLMPNAASIADVGRGDMVEQHRMYVECNPGIRYAR